MGVLYVLLTIIGVIALGASVHYVNGYCMARYAEYAPFNFGTLGMITAAALLFLFGLMTIPDGMTIPQYLDRVETFDWTGMSNSVVAGLASLVIVLGTALYIGSRTNVWVAVFSVVVMAATSILAIIALAIFAWFRSVTRPKHE